ncbi:hypothetical protein J6A31_07420 [bacterium]|nr:hypothetical protein [bacterium]
MGKKNRNTAPETKPVKKKSKSDLALAVGETVWENTIEQFKANKQFIVKGDNGETRFVGLLLDTNQFGGLAGKDCRRDESKGSILEAINTGRIKTYCRIDMLNDNLLLIIPDEDTIENMDEFNLFNTAQYIMCNVNKDGFVTAYTKDGNPDSDDELTVTFDEIRSLVRNKGNVSLILPNGGVNFGTNNTTTSVTTPTESVTESIPNVPEVDDDAEPLPDELDDTSGIEDLDDIPGSVPNSVPDETISDVVEEGESLDDVMSNGSGVDDFSDVTNTSTINPAMNVTNGEVPTTASEADSVFASDPSVMDEDVGGYDTYEDITEEVVHEFVVRKFYSDDLGLEVSTQPFDAQFVHGNSYQPFNENRGTGWLNEYLSNFAKDANTRMERMHNENLFHMRERYMRLIQQHCATISKNLDISTDSTQYGKIRFAIEQSKTSNLDNIDSAVAGKREQLEAIWQAKLNQVGEEAASGAKQAYIDRYGRSHENDIFMLEHHEKEEIEKDYQNAIRRMNDDRRDEASKLLDLAINETLKELSDLYKNVLRDERKEYVRLQNEITRFIDDNRKDEKSRIEALAEENRQVKKANEVRKEYTAKIKAMSAEFDMKKTVLQADIDRMHREHEAELANYQAEWSNKVDYEKTKTSELEQKINDLLQQYADLDAKKSKEYEERMNALKADIETKDINIKHMASMHKRSNIVLIVLVIAIAVAALGIGFMLGTGSNNNAAFAANTNQIVIDADSMSDSCEFAVINDDIDVIID